MDKLLALLAWLASGKPLDRNTVAKLYNSIPANLRNEFSITKLKPVIDLALSGKLYDDKLEDWANKHMQDKRTIRHGTVDQKGWYDAFRKIFTQQSEAARNKIQKDVGKFADPKIASLFDVQLEDNRNDSIEQLAKKLTGKPYVRIPMAVSNKLSQKVRDSQLYKDYRAALKSHNDYWKKWLTKLVRGSGKKTLDAASVAKQAKSAGLKIVNIPDKFVGRIDENGKFYTPDNEPLGGGSVVGTFKLNPGYDPNDDRPQYYGVVHNPDFASGQRMYTDKTKSAAKRQKAEKVEALTKKIDRIVKRWQRDLLTGRGIDKALGAIMEAVWETGGRIGSEHGNTGGEKTYGISSLRVGHIKELGNKLRIKYKGKDGQLQTHLIEPKSRLSKELVRFIKESMEGKSADDRLWDTDKYQITPGKVNQYLRKLGAPKGTTVHKLRHALATKIWLEEEPLYTIKNPDTKAVEEVQKQIGMEVGKQLGHFKNTKDGKHENVAGTSLSSYIPVQLQKAMYDKYNVPYSRRIEKLLKHLK